jgi:hypothetical protein
LSELFFGSSHAGYLQASCTPVDGGKGGVHPDRLADHGSEIK